MAVSISATQPRFLPSLTAYFLLAFALTWGWQIPVFSGAIPFGPWAILGPSTAGLLMAALDGPAGIVRLMKRVVEWRVGLHWYIIALLLVPAIYVANVAILPGGLGALRNLPLASFAATFASGMLPAAFSALFWEEIGWRGYALPRIQQRFGPLRGTLLLGLVWGLWHIPLWAFNPSVQRAMSAGLLGLFAVYGLYVCSVIAYSVYFAWILNHARNSVLLAVLLHASINASIGAFNAYFPSLYPPAVECAEIVVAALLLIATRLRLGYEDSTRISRI